MWSFKKHKYYNVVMNYRLFLFELIFALLIVFAHVSYPAGELYFDSLARATVLFFFILSGYFYTKMLNKEDYNYKLTLKKCLRLLIIAVITIVVYYTVFIPFYWSTLGTPKLFAEGFSWDNCVSFFNNYFPSTSFIWFIFSLIICYLLYPLIYKIKWFKNSKLSIVVPLAILLSIYVYRIICNQYDWGFFSAYQVTRNFLLTGIPCFLISSYIYHHESNLKKISKPAFYTILLALIGTTILEAYLHEVTSNKPNEFYISTLIIAVVSFIYCIQNPESKTGYFLNKVFGSTGPTFVYLFHCFFLLCFGALYKIYWGVLLIIPLADLSALLLGFIYNLIKKKVIKHSGFQKQ